MIKERILIVDDEQDILDLISYNLNKSDYEVKTALNGKDGYDLVQSWKPQLVILDLMMPEMDGIEACEMIRSNTEINQPLITFLTSRAEDYSQIAGLEAGADDYLTKPIRPRLLVSKVTSLLRRKRSNLLEVVEDNKIHTIDKERYLLIVEGKEQEMPKKELELLSYLLSKPGKVFTRDQILEDVWGNETIVGERTIDVHIRKLRERIGDEFIKTIKGVGYKYSIN